MFGDVVEWTWKKVAALIMGAVLLAAIGSEVNTEKLTPSDPVSFELPVGFDTMSCQELGAAHEAVAQRLSVYVSSIYRGSWDAEMAQRRIAADPTAQDAVGVLRTLNNWSESCVYK